jgi:hypothetical protein
MAQPVYQPNRFVPGVDYTQYRQNPQTGEWVYGAGVKFPSQMSDQEYFQSTGGLNRQGQLTLSGTAPHVSAPPDAYRGMLTDYMGGQGQQSMTQPLQGLYPRTADSALLNSLVSQRRYYQ